MQHTDPRARRPHAARVPLRAAALALLAGAASSAAEPDGYALYCGRVLSMDGADAIHDPGLVVVRDGRITYVGPPRDVEADLERVDLPAGWAAPGSVDLHTHIHGTGWGDLNDMVLPINADLMSTPALVPGNRRVRIACAAGVTTLFGIPGSGTSLSGFGILYKTKTDATFEEVVLADPGGMKVAQTHNPERDAGDFGLTRAGLSWLLEDANDKARAALAQDRFDPVLENLKRVHAKELPVLVHCAGSDGVANTARMWRGTYDTHSVLSHGSFDGWRVAPYVARMGMPVNHGPRTMDYYSTRMGGIAPSAYEYWRSGGPDFSLNTDSGVIPQEELFLQGAMAARQGADGYAMLRAITINPARAFGIDDRVGSLEVGKDADVVIYTGDPLDPRTHVEAVWIDGELQYHRDQDGPWF